MLILLRLRDYLRRQITDVVVDEVGTIWDKGDLRILLGAGAPGQVYYAVVGQMARCEGLM